MIDPVTMKELGNGHDWLKGRKYLVNPELLGPIGTVANQVLIITLMEPPIFALMRPQKSGPFGSRTVFIFSSFFLLFQCLFLWVEGGVFQFEKFVHQE